jgi:hypothetical protein
MSDEDGSFLTFTAHPAKSYFMAGERMFPMRAHRTEDFDYGELPGMPESMGRSHYRQAVVPFENRWALSAIYGSHTYSSNRSVSLLAAEQPEFSEEPWAVEVGIFMPESDPETGHDLWGPPLGWVTVGQFHELADAVMLLPSNNVERPGWSYDKHDLDTVEGVVAYLKETYG